MHEMANELIKQSHDVTLLVPSDGSEVENCDTESQGITIIRYKTGKIKEANKIQRALNEITLSVVMYLQTRKYFVVHHHDSIVFYSPSIFFGPFVSYLASMWKVPTYLILRDIFPDWAVQVGILKKRAVYYLFKVFERYQYRVADVIGVESPMNIYVFQQSPYREKIEVLRNWSKTDQPAGMAPTFREKFNLRGKIVFFFGGNIGVAQDMDNIIRLAIRMLDVRQDVHFLLVGAGSEVERLQGILNAKQIVNVTIKPAVHQKAYFSMLSEFDVGLICLDRHLKSHNFPGKMLGYMRCGLPILASINEGNEIGEILTESGAGLSSNNGDNEIFFKNALALCDSHLRDRMASASRQLLLDHFNVEKIVQQMVRSLKLQTPSLPCDK